MSTIQIREQLHQYVDLADERFAGALLAMFKDYFKNQKNAVVAYTVKGEPLTKKQMLKQVNEAVDKVEKGQFRTTEQIRKNILKK